MGRRRLRRAGTPRVPRGESSSAPTARAELEELGGRESDLALGFRGAEPQGRGATPGARTRRSRAGNEKNRLGVTPGGLRVRLLMKETVREPLGGSLLLRIAARIEGRGKQRGHGHADDRPEARGTAENACCAGCARKRERETKKAEIRPIGRMPRPARGFPCERLTEHGQTRVRLRFHQVVLKGEDHRTVTAACSACGLQLGRGCLGETLHTGAAFNL